MNKGLYYIILSDYTRYNPDVLQRAETHGIRFLQLIKMKLEQHSANFASGKYRIVCKTSEISEARMKYGL